MKFKKKNIQEDKIKKGTKNNNTIERVIKVSNKDKNYGKRREGNGKRG